MAVLLANNATSRLASSLTAAATTLSVTTGEGAKFPSPTGGDWFPLTLIKSSGALEILRCTARSGDVFTVTRAQEGTAAQAFSAGDRVEVRLTKAVMDAIVQQINDLTNSALLDTNNLSDLTNAATARGNLGLGTAATRNAQTLPTDTTAGALMAVGAFGLGASFPPATSDIDAIATTMFFFVSGGNANNPFGGNGASGLHMQESQSYGWQLLGVDGGDFALKGRIKTNGIWSAWIDLWTNGNLPVTTFAKTLLDDADAAAARATLGAVSSADVDAKFTGTNVSLAANGYQRLPNGLIIQWNYHDVSVSIGANTIMVSNSAFPIVFPNAVFAVYTAWMSGNTSRVSLMATDVSTAKVGAIYGSDNGSGGTRSGRIVYLAIGR